MVTEAQAARIAATLEDAADLARWGVGLTEAARRLDRRSASALEVFLLRQGANDLLRRLRAQDPLAESVMRGQKSWDSAA
jgi:hypothetical protein